MNTLLAQQIKTILINANISATDIALCLHILAEAPESDMLAAAAALEQNNAYAPDFVTQLKKSVTENTTV